VRVRPKTQVLEREDNMNTPQYPSDIRNKEFRKTIGYYYTFLVIILAAVFLTGCVGNMPSSLEVGAHYAKTAYNKCEALDNWQCLWYDE